MRRGTAMTPAATHSGQRMKLSLVGLFITLSTVACSADDYINDIKTLLRPTLAGYVTVNETAAGKSELWYGLYDAAEPCDTPANEVPIVLWLQGGPGCASTWGAFYGLGPVLVDAEGSGWRRNPYSWNRRFGLLLIDQPVGTGFSAGAPESMIPQDEMWMASDLYTALQGVFQRHSFLRSRPLFITGESYAGKYVPSIGHYILQKQEQHAGVAAVSTPLRYNRQVHEGAAEQPPLFKLAGLAIGNGLTDPVVQTKVMADACWYWGLLDDAEREAATHMQDQVVGLIQNRSWVAAGTLRGALVEYLQANSGSPTLLDVRRARVYDADESVAAALDRAWVKKHLSARLDIRYISCNGVVEDIMAKDIMKSCAHLLPDILDHLPVLLYQGQYDAQDGVASSESWMAQLDWNGIPQFQAAHREKWYRSPGPGEVEGQLLGYWKAHGALTHAVIRDAGHIVPHDAPAAAQAMLERWIFSTSSKLPGHTTASCPPSDPPPRRSIEATS